MSQRMRPESAPVARQPLGLANGAGSSGVLPQIGRGRNKYIKDPGLDPVIAMARDRRKKELEVRSQKRNVSGISGCKRAR